MKNIFRNTAFKVTGGLIILVLLIWGAIALLSHHSTDYVSSVVVRRNLTETVIANGSVTSDESVTLAFNTQGRVTSVSANVGSSTYMGEILAGLDTGTLEASLTGAQADVLAAQAHLTQTQNGARPEELTLYSQKYSDATVALISAMKSAYLAIQDAIVSKSDTLFTNGNTINPTINIHTQSYNEKRAIEEKRIELYASLASLKNDLSSLSPQTGELVATSSILMARATVGSELALAKTYMDDLSTITGNLNSGDSGQTQSVIDSERAIVNAASQEITGAMSAEQTVDAAWSSARDSLTLEQAGGTVEDIQVAEATLGKAQSAVQGLQSQIRQSYIVSPFAGVITEVNVKIGEVYVPGISATEGISLIADGSFKVEVYVPETDIGKITTGCPASVTFDAYGPGTIFTAHVKLIDPAETVLNGVNAYKVTLDFDDPNDVRIKSGLTANIIITIKTVTNVLSVPTRAIITRGTSTIVLIKSAGSVSYVEKPVTTGLKSIDGYTEIISGLNEGDTIANFGLEQ